ncbi:MAG: CpaD family pilus assembly protein [Roseibium sp.]
MSTKRLIRSQAACRIGMMVVGVLVLAACQSKPQSNAALLASNDYRLRHPIVITESPETLDIPVGRNTRSIYGPVADTITAFANEAQHQGNGSVEILVPSGSANEAAVHAVTRDIRGALQRGGLARSRVSTRTYVAEDASADAPIRLSYSRMQATAGECGAWPRNIGGGVGENTDYENFGCSSQANLAAMVVNPSDLITPRASTPSDQGRRAVVIEKYRKGEITAGQFEEGVGAEIAE